MNCVYWHANGDWITEFVQKLNVSQQPRIIYDDGNEHEERSRSSCLEMDDDDASSKSSESEDMKRMEVVILEYINQQLDLEKRIGEQEEDAENLRSQIDIMRIKNGRMQEEVESLRKQKQAFTKRGGETEIELLNLTEELVSEKRAILDKYETSKMLFEKQSQQLEAALEIESKSLQVKEKEHALEVEDLQAQIDALQKQIFSSSKFSAEQTTEREVEREEFQQEINLLHNELEKQHELRRSDSKLSQEVSYLEDEMEARDLAHREQLERMKLEEEKLRRMLREYEESLQELREKERDQSELNHVKGQLQDVIKERDGIEQDLCNSLFKISELKKKLLCHKRGNATTNTLAINDGAGDTTHLEALKMRLHQETEVNESKIDHLVGVQGQLRAEILKKEQEIGRLQQKVKNMKLKKKSRSKDEDFAPIQLSGTKPEDLSTQLNGEIDEVQIRSQDVETKKNFCYSESLGHKNKDSLNVLKEENSILQSRLQELEKQLTSAKKLTQALHGASTLVEDPHAEDCSLGEVLSSLQVKLNSLEQENKNLKTETNELKDLLKASPSSSIFGSLPEISEKYRQLEELLETKKGGDSTQEGENEDSSIVGAKANLEEKLRDLEGEVKSQPESILGRILVAKDNKILERDQKIKQAEDTLTEQSDKMNELKEKVSDLKRNLAEPDVKVHMRSKGKKGKEGEEKEIEVEKVRPENIKEISTVVKRVKIISGKPVITKTICTVRCKKVAIYF